MIIRIEIPFVNGTFMSGQYIFQKCSIEGLIYDNGRIG